MQKLLIWTLFPIKTINIFFMSLIYSEVLLSKYSDSKISYLGSPMDSNVLLQFVSQGEGGIKEGSALQQKYLYKYGVTQTK